METRGRIQDGTGDGSGDGNETIGGDGNGDKDGNGDGIGESAGETKKSKKNNKRVVDAMWETGDTWVEREKNVDKKGLVQQLPTQII